MAEIYKQILEDEEKFNEVVKEAFDNTDKNKTGEIDKDSLRAMMNQILNDLSYEPPTDKEVNDVFNYLDLNKKGYICINDIQEILNLKKDADINIINELKKEFPNNECKINFEEFKAMMISFAQEDMFNSIMRRKISDDDSDIFSEKIDDNSLENSFD